jgi:hypothetical protein
MDALVAKSAKRKSNTDKKKPVRCVETGVVYGSSTDAAELLSEQGIDICPDRIRTVCRGKQKSAGGFKWEYACSQAHKDTR